MVNPDIWIYFRIQIGILDDFGFVTDGGCACMILSLSRTLFNSVLLFCVYMQYVVHLRRIDDFV